MSVDIANESGKGVDEAALASIARHVLDELRIHPLAELSVLLVDDKVMADLHERWMGEPGPADVLAFPMDELRPPAPPQLSGARGDRSGAEGPDPSPALLGDVVLCPQVAARQARDAGHSLGDELALLCTHGLLHLLGYDHADAEERSAMFSLQDQLLVSWRAGRGGSAGPAMPAPPSAGDRRAGPTEPASRRARQARAAGDRGSDPGGRKGPG